MRTYEKRIKKALESIGEVEKICTNKKTSRKVRRSNEKKLRPLYRKLDRLRAALKRGT